MKIKLYTMDDFVKCIAGIVKQGLTFDAWRDDAGWYWIELTGGY